MIKRILIAFLFLLSTSAYAGLLIEPYLGFSIGSGEDGQNPKTEYSQNTPFYGGRLGYQAFGLMAGLDYSKGLEGDFETKTAGSATTKADATQQTFGVFVGYNFPIMLRAWVSYNFASKISIESGAEVGDEFKGGGYAFGLGFTALPMLSINLEYRMNTFDEYKTASTGVTSALNGTEEIDYNQILLSVSLPLDI